MLKRLKEGGEPIFKIKINQWNVQANFKKPIFPGDQNHTRCSLRWITVGREKPQMMSHNRKGSVSCGHLLLQCVP